MKKLRLLALAVAVGASLPATAVGGGRPLDATLTGAAEVPGPGDPDGSGSADLRLNQGQRTICYVLTWTNIAAPTAAHIHEAPAGQSAPPLLTLFGGPANAAPTTTPPVPAASPAEACVQGVDRALIKDIRKNPEDYYVNIHNAEFSGGAIRGQLSK